MTGEHISKQFQDLKNGRCPLCKHTGLRDVTGQYEFSHVGECKTRGKHVFNRYYSGLQCRFCSWTNRTFVVK